jgi:uncharacterized coiled-coil protein SlyX
MSSEGRLGQMGAQIYPALINLDPDAFYHLENASPSPFTATAPIITIDLNPKPKSQLTFFPLLFTRTLTQSQPTNPNPNRYGKMADQRLAEAERTIAELRVKVSAVEQLNRQTQRKYARLLERVERIEQVLQTEQPVPEAAADGEAMDVDEDEVDDEEVDDGEEEDEGEGEDEEHEGDEDGEEGEEEDESEEAQEEMADTHPFKCTRPGCHFEYAHQNRLAQHMANTHDSDPATRKPHVCPICSANYDTVETLKNHRILHKPAGYHLASRRPVRGGCICPVPGCGKDCKNLLSRRNHLSHNHKGWRTAHPQWKNN